MKLTLRQKILCAIGLSFGVYKFCDTVKENKKLKEEVDIEKGINKNLESKNQGLIKEVERLSYHLGKKEEQLKRLK